MLSFRTLGLFVLAFPIISTFAAPSITTDDTVRSDAVRSDADANFEAFQELLASLDESSLHAVLHDLNTLSQYKHGVFEKDRTILEAVHQYDPPLATHLVTRVKRQADNSTTTTETAAATTKTVSASPTDSPTSAAASSAVSTAESTLSTSASNPVQPSSRTSADVTPSGGPQTATSTVVESATSAPASSAGSSAGGSVATTVVRTTERGSTATVIASPTKTPTPNTVVTVTSEITSGAVITQTDSAGSTQRSTVQTRFTTVTSAPAAVSDGSTQQFTQESSTVLQTTTLPDGSRSTITAVTIVNAPVTSSDSLAAPTGPAGASSTTSAAPGLQSGAASATQGLKLEMFAMIGGAFMVAMAM